MGIARLKSLLKEGLRPLRSDESALRWLRKEIKIEKQLNKKKSLLKTPFKRNNEQAN